MGDREYMTFDGSQADYFGPAIEQEPGSATIILSDDVHGSGADFLNFHLPLPQQQHVQPLLPQQQREHPVVTFL